MIAGRYAAVVDRLSAGRTRLIGAALARVLLGAAALNVYIASYAQRGFLWGPRGISPLEERSAWGPLAESGGLLPSFSLYFLSSSNAWFECVFHGGIIASAAFMLFGGRVLALVHWIFLTSLLERVAIPLEGGDKVARILVLLLALACTNAYLSPAARRRREAADRPNAPVAALVHNVAILLAVFQIAAIYFASGVAKLHGARWLDGTAVYYATRFDAMHFLAGLDWMSAKPAIAAALTGGVVALEFLYPVLILWRPTRRLAVGLAIAMHAGIGLKMGLVTFALVMLAANALVLTDDDYREFRRRSCPQLPQRNARRPDYRQR